MKWARTKKNCYFLGMGDYDDLLSYSERKSITNAHLHESTNQTLDELYLKHTLAFADEIRFMKNRIIGLIEGNHHATFINGTTTTQKLCELLNCKYLGVASFIRLVFRYSTKSTSVDIFAHHGKGGSGRMVGSDLNHIQAMGENSDAQILLMGHSHKKGITMKTRLSLSNNRMGNLYLTHKKIIMARTGSFLKGYEPEAPSYVAKACMSPTDLGVVKIELTPKRETDNNKDLFYIDIHGSI